MKAIDFTKLTRDNIVDLLESAGYNETSSDIIDTEFVAVNNGKVRYKMTYYDIDDNLMEDNIFVFIDYDGKLTADY